MWVASMGEIAERTRAAAATTQHLREVITMALDDARAAGLYTRKATGLVRAAGTWSTLVSTSTSSASG
jgi:glycerol-3-phosphate dehydrogenase